MKKRNPSHKRFLSEKLNSVAEHISPYRRSLFTILIFGVLLSGCSGLSSQAVDLMRSIPSELTFEPYEIVTGTAKHQTVLTGFLLGSPIAELVVVSVDENIVPQAHTRPAYAHLHIYAFSDRTWMPRHHIRLRPEVLLVDVANIGGRDRLITYESGQLNWFDPESATEHVLVTVPSMVPPPHTNIPHVDLTHDVNGDDREDMVIPDSDGFWVFVQTENGGFTDPLKLGPSTTVNRIYQPDEYRHTPWNKSRIHEMDYNRDGRNDLVFWNTDRFEVHHQEEHGGFASVATTFTTQVAFDTDDLASLAAPHGVRHRLRDHNPTGNLTGRVLHSLTDMNNDGIVDLAIFSLLGGSLWHMHSSYEVHLGTPTPDGGIAFSPDVSTAIHAEGIPFGMGQYDFDRDGQIDVMFTTLKLGVFRVIGILIDGILSGSVSRDLEIYRMKDGIYPKKPNATRKIEVYPRSESGEKAATFPSLLIGDVNGDKYLDLLVQKEWKELRVFLGVPGPNLFTRKPKKVAVTVPNNEKHTWLVDLNKDDKQDILMYHPDTTDSHRVTLLIAH